MKGSSRKPLALQKGNLNIYTIQQREYEESLVKAGTEQVLNPPSWMTDKDAIKEWHRVVPQLVEIDIIGNLDMSNIAGYCIAYSNWKKATEELEKTPLVYKENGRAKENPFVDVQNKYAQEMRRFADMCGLSISSRLKAAADKAKAIDAEIVEEFGDI